MENPTTIVLSRLVAQQRAMDVTAVNIANATTPGFRRSRMIFSDYLTTEPTRAEPRGGRVVAYTQDRGTYRDHLPGSLQQTANPLDLAINGQAGWFTVLTKQGARLTRAGHFELDSKGTIVDEQANPLLDATGKPMVVGPTDTSLTVSADGALASQNGPIGKIGIVQPADENRLTPEGARLFVSASPTQPVGAPRLVQGAIEDSNVEPISELTRMMTDQREFQFTTEFLQGESDRQSGAIDKILKKGN